MTAERRTQLAPRPAAGAGRAQRPAGVPQGHEPGRTPGAAPAERAGRCGHRPRSGRTGPGRGGPHQRGRPQAGDFLRAKNAEGLLRFLLKDVIRPQAMVPNSVRIAEQDVEYKNRPTRAGRCPRRTARRAAKGGGDAPGRVPANALPSVAMTLFAGVGLLRRGDRGTAQDSPGSRLGGGRSPSCWADRSPSPVQRPRPAAGTYGAVSERSQGSADRRGGSRPLRLRRRRPGPASAAPGGRKPSTRLSATPPPGTAAPATQKAAPAPAHCSHTTSPEGHPSSCARRDIGQVPPGVDSPSGHTARSVAARRTVQVLQTVLGQL